MSQDNRAAVNVNVDLPRYGVGPTGTTLSWMTECQTGRCVFVIQLHHIVGVAARDYGSYDSYATGLACG